MSERDRHLTTPVLSTAGLSVWIFAIGTILSLPKNVSRCLPLAARMVSDTAAARDRLPRCRARQHGRKLEQQSRRIYRYWDFVPLLYPSGVVYLLVHEQISARRLAET